MSQQTMGDDGDSAHINSAFWAGSFWRQQPRLIRGMVPNAHLSGFGYPKIEEIVSRLPHMRVFVPEASNAKGPPRSRLVPGSDSLELLRKLARSDIRYTLLFNNVETVDSDVVQVRDLMTIPYDWRKDDVVLTFSAIGSGIGYHAGHEDAFIVQASGRRRWRVWAAAEMDSEARRRILISAPGDIYAFSRSATPPIIDCELEPGDVLYIPPFCPHEGTTLANSISIALGWRGISYYHLVQAFPQNIHLPNRSSANAAEALFMLLPDYSPSGNDCGIVTVVETIIASLEKIECVILDKELLKDRLRMMMGACPPITQN